MSTALVVPEEVLCLAKACSLLVSGAADGSLKLWNLDDGSTLDMKAEPQDAGAITCVQFVGPMMVRVRVGSDR